MSRYKNGKRTLMSWRDPEYKVAIAMAWYFHQVKGVRNPEELWEAVAEHFGEMTKMVLRQQTTWPSLCADALKRFGCEITPHRLMQRADKSHRYGEHTEYRDAVVNNLIF